MQLWTDEMEALRTETRVAVHESLASVIEMMGGGAFDAEGLSRDEQVALARQAMTNIYYPSPEAELREFAGVPCRVFTPSGRASAIYLHFHGGGMMIGAPEMSDYSSVDLRDRFNLAVVSVDYRLAPEHPHPAGPDDGVTVADWLLANGERELGASRLILGGESAGGYMSAIVLLRIRDELCAIDRVAGANLVFGVYDWGRSPSQRGIRPAAGPDLLDPVGIEFFTECYLPGLTDDERRDPSISPAFADLSDLAARAHERRHVGPLAGRHAHALRPVGGCGQRGRPGRAARDAARIHGRPGRDGGHLDAAHQRLVRRHPSAGRAEVPPPTPGRQTRRPSTIRVKRRSAAAQLSLCILGRERDRVDEPQHVVGVDVGADDAGLLGPRDLGLQRWCAARCTRTDRRRAPRARPRRAR